jgi:RNA polymerase sigma factor (sigma-70 family)
MSRDLVHGLRQGDPVCYREALHTYGDSIYTFLLRLSGRRDVAEDLFQETWLALARHAARLSTDTNLAAWLFTVARNAYRSHRRWVWLDAVHWAVEGAEAAFVSRAPSPEDHAVADETATALDRALSRLRRTDREILLLVGLQGVDSSEIAGILGIGPEAFRQRLSRARKALSAELETTSTRSEATP